MKIKLAPPIKHEYLMIDRKGNIYLDRNAPLGEPLAEVYDSDIAALFLKNVRKALRSKETVNVEYSVSYDNEKRWFLASIQPMVGMKGMTWTSAGTDITELKITQDRLRADVVKLEEMNRALKATMDNMKESNKDLQETMFSNIRMFVLPHIKNLKRMRLDDVQMAYVELIETNLSKLISPLIHDMRQFGLTPMEIQVANLIKDGKTTKDIARLLHTSKVAIDNHRYNIRKKFGINNNKENLRSFLLSIK
ncbi:helix-turn-helix transcriptional regulator [bacterium]|nr:helix-turn-helix transcriptional regulator [bacterium]